MIVIEGDNKGLVIKGNATIKKVVFGGRDEKDQRKSAGNSDR